MAVVAMALAMVSLVGAGGPAEAASAAALSPSVTVDTARTSFAASVVGYGPNGGFKAVFGKGHKFKNRIVSLQWWDEPGQRWVESAMVKMTAGGEAVFATTPVPGRVYRAVADKFSYTVKKKRYRLQPVATRSLDPVPAPVSYYSFTAPEPDWTPRNTGQYTSAGRSCSAPAVDHVSYGGKAVLKVTKSHKATRACKYGRYRNAMISTQDVPLIKVGTVSARVKFPLGQGMHAGVWLQSADSEIDIVESYGYGKGITSGAHIRGKQKVSWVATSKVKSKSWWSSYHTVSAQRRGSTITIRLDGATVKTVTGVNPDTEYFLVLSLLSSDWELSRLTKPIKGAKGVKKTDLKAASSKFYVDWVKVWAA